MTEQPKRPGFPLWMLAVGIPAVGALLCCCVGGIGFVAYRWGASTAPVPQKDAPVAKAPGKDQPEKPAGPLTYEAVSWGELYWAYRDNEAAADAKYLNKGIRVTVNFWPGGVEKDQGRYYAWGSMVSAPAKQAHCKFYFRDDKDAASLAEWGMPSKEAKNYTIRGICVGKQGTLNTMLAGLMQPLPVIVVKDCVLGAGEDRSEGKSLERFLAQRPKAPTTITVNCRFCGDYKNAYTGAAATHYGLLINSYPPPLTEAMAYVPKNSDAGRKVLEATKDKGNQILTLEVVLQGPDGTPTPTGGEEMAILKVLKAHGPPPQTW